MIFHSFAGWFGKRIFCIVPVSLRVFNTTKTMELHAKTMQKIRFPSHAAK